MLDALCVTTKLPGTLYAVLSYALGKKYSVWVDVVPPSLHFENHLATLRCAPFQLPRRLYILYSSQSRQFLYQIMVKILILILRYFCGVFARVPTHSCITSSSGQRMVSLLTSNLEDLLSTEVHCNSSSSSPLNFTVQLTTTQTDDELQWINLTSLRGSLQTTVAGADRYNFRTHFLQSYH
jgi:hypothetical protein